MIIDASFERRYSLMTRSQKLEWLLGGLNRWARAKRVTDKKSSFDGLELSDEEDLAPQLYDIFTSYSVMGADGLANAVAEALDGWSPIMGLSAFGELALLSGKCSNRNLATNIIQAANIPYLWTVSDDEMFKVVSQCALGIAAHRQFTSDPALLSSAHCLRSGPFAKGWNSSFSAGLIGSLAKPPGKGLFFSLTAFRQEFQSWAQDQPLTARYLLLSLFSETRPDMLSIYFDSMSPNDVWVFDYLIGNPQDTTPDRSGFDWSPPLVANHGSLAHMVKFSWKSPEADDIQKTTVRLIKEDGSKHVASHAILSLLPPRPTTNLISLEDRRVA